MNDISSLCQQFGDILNGKANVNNGTCSVSLPRHLGVTIQGRPTKSALHASFTFESLDQEGNALNIGEVVLLEHEIPAFMYMLVSQGLIVSALHNHWIFANPNILYIHFQSVEPPLDFAEKGAKAMAVLDA